MWRCFDVTCAEHAFSAVKLVSEREPNPTAPVAAYQNKYYLGSLEED
jgi:hypothetical protein